MGNLPDASFLGITVESFNDPRDFAPIEVGEPNALDEGAVQDPIREFPERAFEVLTDFVPDAAAATVVTIGDMRIELVPDEFGIDAKRVRQMIFWM